ncbi:MAG: type II toxin-antitoxin system PemK/MazF family toxin [Propionibacteriaceae bacterium]|uniref:mRNA interferase PemK-like protein n=1 Tax=Propionibacterium ruminifibrarum TaxID=1962131 RepID=A0A375I3S6_9ACTN|nr:type II toxin-antitoxin system PemK/MazF family toxin [Propionibacterium ruminifibrarum]MBE6477151.1 type II toxin-antitoxin system PemK/MazF family toxin [Propionibacteriaceae bacterium]SPF69567.1 mRNA interferase PemK-like protein [Propionibacterium ruminifibrarum]
MRRGEVWTLRDDAYASKARPVVVVQSDDVAGFGSVVLCLFTSFDSSGVPTRVPVKPSGGNGLAKPSYVMTDKIVTVDKQLLGKRVGILGEEDMAEVSRQLIAVLGLGQG